MFIGFKRYVVSDAELKRRYQIVFLKEQNTITLSASRTAPRPPRLSESDGGQAYPPRPPRVAKHCGQVS